MQTVDSFACRADSWDSRSELKFSSLVAAEGHAKASAVRKMWVRIQQRFKTVTESNKLALSHAYAVPKDGQIGQAYFDRSMPVVNAQLAKAGMRLAALLNAIFDDTAELDFIARPDTDRHPHPTP